MSSYKFYCIFIWQLGFGFTCCIKTYIEYTVYVRTVFINMMKFLVKRNPNCSRNI